MSRVRFKYNLKTLRYERVKISFINVLITILGYLSIGALFFVGLVLLQNYVIESPAEKKLRSENSELKKHKVILASQLGVYNQQLEQLKQEDLELYNRLFEISQRVEKNESESSKIDILIADSPDFDSWMETVNKYSSDVNNSARYSNQLFHQTASVDKNDVKKIFAMPSIAPVENFDVAKLVSGFGNRINPFHKGSYHHDGVDIAAARGTNVLAAGHGQVIAVKRNDMVAGFGNYIEIDHGYGIVTRYSHLEDVQARVGQKVRKGQPIGTVGSSGGSIAPHLHFEVIADNVNVDPVKYFIEQLTADQFKELVIRSKKMNQSLD